MVASDIDESVLVLAETAFSHSANGFHSIDATGRESRSNTRRRTSQRAIVTRASLKGFSSATFSVLKETYETWGHDHKKRFSTHHAEARDLQAVRTLQRCARQWRDRQLCRAMLLEKKLYSIRRQTRLELLQIKSDMEEEKAQIRREAELAYAMDIQRTNDTLAKGRKIIEHLRSENKLLRVQNQEIQRGIEELRAVNERMEAADESSEGSLDELNGQTVQIINTYMELRQQQSFYSEQLIEYQLAIHELHEKSCAEKLSRTHYEDAVGTIFENLKTRMTVERNRDLSDELIQAILHHKASLQK